MPTGSLPTSPTSSIPSSRAALSGEIPNEGGIDKAQAATLLLVAESSLFGRRAESLLSRGVVNVTASMRHIRVYCPYVPLAGPSRAASTVCNGHPSTVSSCETGVLGRRNKAFSASGGSCTQRGPLSRWGCCSLSRPDKRTRATEDAGGTPVKREAPCDTHVAHPEADHLCLGHTQRDRRHDDGPPCRPAGSSPRNGNRRANPCRRYLG